MKHIFLLFAVCVLIISFTAAAQVPQKISYQGLLTTSSGAPVQDGSYNLRFDFYNLPSAGTLRHTETHTAVPVERGTFSVILGPLPAIFSESLYVEVTALSGPGISGPLTFSPRSELTSAPYALHAQYADTADYARNVLPYPWNINGSSIYYSAGNVGIGTTVPSELFELSGYNEPLIKVTNTAMVGAPYLLMGMNAGNNAAIFLASHHKDFKFYNGQYALTILGSNGNVGVGTTTPDADAKLDVNGYTFAKAPVMIYDGAAGGIQVSFPITWLNDVRVDNNIVEKQGNNYEFMLKKVGWYRISYFIYFNNTNQTLYRLYISKNGAGYKTSSVWNAGGLESQVNATVTVQSDGDDIISLVAAAWDNIDTFSVRPDGSFNQLTIEYLGAE